MTCQEYQDDLKRRADSEVAAKKTQEMLEVCCLSLVLVILSVVFVDIIGQMIVGIRPIVGHEMRRIFSLYETLRGVLCWMV